MISLEAIHTFNYPFVSAASGLVLMKEKFYLVADDELFAVALNKNNLKQIETITLFEGVLAQEKKLRKKMKPDLESIVRLPSGELLCIPSGSKDNRIQGVLIKSGSLEIKHLSFEALYTQLSKTFSELNIEGAVVVNECLRLFQRGNGKHQQNASIDVNLEDLMREKINIKNVKHYDLGQLNGVNLSFTDATMAKGKIYFLAVAEASESTYLDGEYQGSVLGTMNVEGNILKLEELELKFKPEGLCADDENFYVVTDADDRTKPSILFKGKLPV